MSNIVCFANKATQLSRCMGRSRKRVWRPAFTLLELMLSLSLIVVATALIGSLMSLYARSFTARGDAIKQKQLARSLLTMIADDIRAVVVTQSYDSSVLQQMLGGSSSSGATASSTSSTGTGSGSNTSTSPSPAATSPSSATEAVISTLPPGLYGWQNQLMVDVSRIPRNTDFNRTPSSIGTLSDVPGDVKTVTYLIQAGGPIGVQDTMAQLGTTSTIASNGGLVRRALDRHVMSYAEENGSALSLNSTGDLVAPEAVALEFSYYDGTQWLTQWDSSQQGLPWLIQVSLALQSPESALSNPINGGISLATLSASDKQSYGIEIFQLTVAIPGANLQAAPTGSQTSSGMEAAGL